MNRSILGAARRLSVIVLAALASPACGGAAMTKAPACPAPPAQPVQPSPPKAAAPIDDDVAVDDFTAPLALYGAWVDVAPYGRVWQPSNETVGQDFMPYGTAGQWAVNEDGDWVFEGKHDEAFGWATYHYGRWLQHDEYGWVWIPGTSWAPAWVSWRFGGGHVGWAPAGPEGVSAPPERWVVVEEKHFLDDGAIHARLDADRVAAVWSATPPLTQAHGGYGGPPPGVFKALGQTPYVSHARKPGRGETREKAKAVALKGAGKPPAKARGKSKASRARTTARSATPREKKGAGSGTGAGSGSQKK